MIADCDAELREIVEELDRLGVGIAVDETRGVRLENTKGKDFADSFRALLTARRDDLIKVAHARAQEIATAHGMTARDLQSPWLGPCVLMLRSTKTNELLKRTPAQLEKMLPDATRKLRDALKDAQLQLVSIEPRGGSR